MSRPDAFYLLANGDRARVYEWECDPDSMFKTNSELDYTIVKVPPKNGEKVGEKWGFFNLRHGASEFTDQRVNIIQHPQGRFMEIGFRDNQVKDVTDRYIEYLTDTDYGSSGSPVLDDWFNVIALHNQRVRDPNDPNRCYRNQGYRVDAILADAGDMIP